MSQPTRSTTRRRLFACPIYHAAPHPAVEGLEEWRPIDELLDSGPAPGAAVVLVGRTLLSRIDEIRQLPHYVVIVAADADTEATLGSDAHVSMAGIDDPAARSGVIQAACELACARRTSTRRWRYMTKSNRKLNELVDIGKDLMYEHDRVILLHRILEVGKRFTQSDGGALFITESQGQHAPWLRLVLYEVDSIPDLPDLSGSTLAIDNKTIIGHAALTGRPIVVADAYELPADVGFEADQGFDTDYGYRRRSMLVLPMVDQLAHVLGVLMFMNRKTEPHAVIRTKADADRYVVEYAPREVRLARSLAGEAAVAIENARLYEQIERTLESFVKAAASAIDQRDPATSGHSVRVAALATALARAVDRDRSNTFHGIHFNRRQMRELRFAALLHDFGKVAVRDEVLLKAKKLPTLLWERVNGRFALIHRTLEVEHYKQRERVACGPDAKRALVRLDSEFADRIAELERMRRVVLAANEPSIDDRLPAPELEELARRTFTLPDGTAVPYLTNEEVHYLSIRHGTLDERERAEVEAHVSETYAFLSRIPWTDDLKNLAPFAYGHHEKLSGVGYPRGLHGEDIPIQTRMITIADMFDALTEADRPYKPAVSADKAIEILEGEAKSGRLDLDLVRLMADAKPYEHILNQDWREL